MFAIINGMIVTKNEILKSHALIIEKDNIVDVVPQKNLPPNIFTFDCENQYVLPGLIDIHCDCIETEIVPRKGIIFDPKFALQQIDRRLLSNGITTIYHSVSIANSTIVNKKRTLSVEQQLDIGKAVSELKKSLIITHKFHSRIELNTPEAMETIIHMIDLDQIDELSFMDHTPGQGQYTNIDEFRKEIDKQYGILNEEKQNELIEKCCSKCKISLLQIQNISKLCNHKNIPLAYHDVDTFELLNWMKSLNFTICEFPITLNIAKEARSQTFHTVVGAPNILHGKSHNGNLSAIELLRDGYANIICSDYYLSSMLPAIFKLKTYGINLSEAVNFASYYPAKAMGLNDRGTISAGRKADLILVTEKQHFPVVTNVFISGKLRYKVTI